MATEAREEQPRPRRHLPTALLLVVAGFLLGAAFLRASVPPPSDHELEARLTYLESANPPIDIVVLGASTVRRAFVPEAFDAELRRAGHDVRSFNLGVPGAYQYEIDHVLDLALARMSPPPRWVVIELPTRPLPALIPAENAFTDRVVHWHTPGQLRAVLSHLWDQTDRRFELAPIALSHLRHAAWHFASVGQGDRVAARWLGLWEDERRNAREIAAASRGFEPLRIDDGLPPGLLRREFLAHPQRYQEALDYLDSGRFKRKGRTLSVSMIRRQVERIQAAGSRALFLVTPGVQAMHEIHVLHRAGVIPELIAYNSPKDFPDLYAVEHRYDSLHLNATGAEIFSRVFARRFAPLLEVEDD